MATSAAGIEIKKAVKWVNKSDFTRLSDSNKAKLNPQNLLDTFQLVNLEQLLFYLIFNTKFQLSQIFLLWVDVTIINEVYLGFLFFNDDAA